MLLVGVCIGSYSFYMGVMKGWVLILGCLSIVFVDCLVRIDHIEGVGLARMPDINDHEVDLPLSWVAECLSPTPGKSPNITNRR